MTARYNNDDACGMTVGTGVCHQAKLQLLSQLNRPDEPDHDIESLDFLCVSAEAFLAFEDAIMDGYDDRLDDRLNWLQKQSKADAASQRHGPDATGRAFHHVFA